MQGKSTNLSREALFDFFDFAAEKGLLKKATAAARKKACQTILGILNETEADDLSKVDLEDVIQRHRNLAVGKIIPKTLVTYESRTRTAVKDFFGYIKNPSSWKPLTTQRPSRSKPAKAAKDASVFKKSEMPGKQGKMPPQPPVHIDFQIHISPEATPEQIDQIFASMRRHLYGNRTGQ